jgi:hypothetical protein
VAQQQPKCLLVGCRQPRSIKPGVFVANQQ